jgi:lysophospholipase L1-like esterase
MKFLIAAIFLTAGAGMIVAQRQPVTIFLAGDSTIAAKADDKRPETGWGEMLEKRFKPGTVKVDNRAMNGRSTTSFIAEERWKALIDSVKKGDFVFIQFGHNDQKKDKPGVYAAPKAYKANLSGFVNDVRAKGATPVLMTSIARRRFEAGKVVQTHGEYPDLVKDVAKDHNVAVIDMGRKTAAVLALDGEEGSKKLFLHLKPGEHANYPKGVEDNTHLSPYGADVFAGLAIEGIRESKLGKLTRHLVDQ